MTNPIENALQKGTFNVLEAAKGRGYPVDSVTLFTALDAEYEIRKIDAKLLDGTLADESRLELETRRLTLVEEIKDSALTFHMRGISPQVSEAIYAEADAHLADESNDSVSNDSERNMFANDAIIAAHIIKVENASGEEDAEWDREKVTALRAILPEGEMFKLLQKVSELSFAAAAFDEVVGPDFS